MAYKAYQTHSRDSHLPFAVVWDPETGLEAYSCDPRCLHPISGEYDFPESIYSGSQVDDESVIFSDTVSGRPRTHFIDPHAPCVCGRYTFGLGDSVFQSSLKSSSTPTSSFSPAQTHSFPKSLDSSPSSTRPSSKWTFAALWDQKTGLSAFSQGKLAKFIPSTKHHKWPSTSTSGSAPDTGHRSYEYMDNVKRGFYLRVLPEIGSAASSSPVEHQHDPHFSCFDALDEWSLFEPHLNPFPQSASGPVKKANHLPGAATVNDDYVMKGDVDSHLPSRFSTSTSGFVPISPTSVHIIPPITFLGSRSSTSRSPRKRGKLSRSKSAGLQHETELPCIPRFFKNAPWSKGSEDGKWVLVEVQSVVTDRVIDD